MVLFVMSYNNNDSYIDPNKIYRIDMNNSTDTNVLNEQVTSLFASLLHNIAPVYPYFHSFSAGSLLPCILSSPVVTRSPTTRA